MHLPMINTNSKLIRVLLALPILAIIAILAIYSAWPHYKAQTKKTEVINSYDYTYGNLDNYSISGIQPGTGISFQKPVEFKSSLADKKAPIADLTHKVGKLQMSVAEIVAFSQPPTVDLSSQTLASAMSHPDSANYTSIVAPIEKMASFHLSGLQASYQDARQITTADLKSGAWALQFTTTTSNNSHALTKSGEVLIIAGKNGYYYFLLDALDNNWDKNQNVWRRVVDSIQIDQ